MEVNMYTVFTRILGETCFIIYHLKNWGGCCFIIVYKVKHANFEVLTAV
jgi:hypothetical protein